MIKIPHLYRVEAGPLGPAKRPPPPDPADNPVVERWRAVDGKPHLEQNDRGQIRTKDFMNESNNPYPSVPDKNTIEPMKPYFDPGVEDYGCWENPANSVISVIREELQRGLGPLLDPFILRDALTEVGVGLSKFWSSPQLRSGEGRTRAINFGLDIAKSAYLRLASMERIYYSPGKRNAMLDFAPDGVLRFRRPNQYTYHPQIPNSMLDLVPDKQPSITLVNLTKEKIASAQKSIEDIFSEPSAAQANGTVTGSQIREWSGSRKFWSRYKEELDFDRRNPCGITIY